MAGTMRVLRSSLLLALLLLPWLPDAARGDVTDPGIVAARELFYQGVDGDKRAVREALRQFRQLQGAQPNNPLLQAYIGACAALMGRDNINEMNKRTNTSQAVREIDAALAALARLEAEGGGETLTISTILETKLVAANAFIHIPSFYNRRQEGERLLRELRADPRLDFMSPGFQAAVLVAYATLVRKNEVGGNPVPLLRRAHELDPQGRDGRRAQQMLAGETE